MSYICNEIEFKTLSEATNYAEYYHNITSNEKGFNGIVLGIEQNNNQYKGV